MRICYLADAKSPHTQKWVSHFAAEGHEVHVISFRGHDIQDATVHHVPPPFIDSEVELLHAGRGRLQKAAYFLCARTVKRLIKEIQPDVLHAFLATSYGFVGATSGFHPLIISSLGSEIVVLPETSSFYRRLVRFNLRRADVVTATSDFLSRATERYCPAGTTVETIAFGVDTKNFSPNGRKYLDDVPVTIGTVKILERNYGIDRLIKTFEKVIRLRPDLDLSLLIVGGGSLEKSLKKLGRRLGIANHVTFVGNLPHHKVMAFLRQIDIFASLPESETFGVSVVEASACAIPVVVSNVGGLPEVVRDGETGFLVPPMDSEITARQIVRLAADANLRRQMGQAGRRLVLDRYGWQDNADRMQKIYEMATAERGALTG